MADWLTSYDALPTKPVECVQESGETLFIPSDYVHCLLNIEESVGIAIEIGPESHEEAFIPQYPLSELLKDKGHP